MMPKKQSLQKMLKLFEQQEALLVKKCADSHRKLKDAVKTFDFLSACLKEYRDKLAIQTQGLICAYQYQRFCRFIVQLDSALTQQSLTIDRLQGSHRHLLIEYELLKNKLIKLQKLIKREQKQSEYTISRKDNQDATDLFNQLKHDT